MTLSYHDENEFNKIKKTLFYGVGSVESFADNETNANVDINQQKSDIEDKYKNRFDETLGGEFSIEMFNYQDYQLTSAETGARGDMGTLVFPANDTNFAEFASTTPSDYGGRPFDVLISWVSTEGSGNVNWQVDLNASGAETDASGLNYYGLPHAGDFESAGSGIMNTSKIRLSAAAMQELNPSDPYAFRIQRLGESTEDTLSVSAEVVNVEVRESSNID